MPDQFAGHKPPLLTRIVKRLLGWRCEKIRGQWWYRKGGE